MCGLGTYHDSLDLAFRNATTGPDETLLIVEVLPSFQPEYALVIKRAGSEVSLVRAKFQTQLWMQLAPLQAPRTRQECLDLATAARLDTVSLPIRPENMNEILLDFGNIRLLETDKCPRRGKDCALIQDATAYIVLPKDGQPVRITDTARLKGIRNENAALLDWIHNLLLVSNNSRPD